jgi:hypothetical protein
MKSLNKRSHVMLIGKENEKTTQAVKATPQKIKEKEPLWYRVL